MEFALLCLNIKSVLQQSLQNLSNVNPVLLHGLGEDQDVIDQGLEDLDMHW